VIPTWLATTIPVGAIATTYAFRVPPGLKGRWVTNPTTSASGTGMTRGDGKVDRQLAALRDEPRILRAHDVLDTRPPSPPPASDQGSGDA
jgi:hypothetical protein